MIYLHLGVHKTATTYLQDLLALNQGRIATVGRAYWRLEQIRPFLAAGFRQKRAFNRRSLAALRRPRGVMDTDYLQMANRLAVAMPSVLSEENLLGLPSEALEGPFYIHARERLCNFAQIAAGHEIEIFLSIRSYAPFLASLYSEALRHGWAGTTRDLVTKNVSPAGQWPRLVRLIHEVFPNARITLWCYEAFRTLEPEIVERLSGMPADALRPLSSDDVRPSPSAKAIAMQEEHELAKPYADRVIAMAANEDRYTPANWPERFDPWPDHARSAMDAAYADDTAEIKALPYVEWLG